MKKYKFYYTEEFVKAFEVEAENEDEAYEKADDMAYNGEFDTNDMEFDHWDIRLA